MTNEEKLALRLNSLEDGLSTVQILKINGKFVLWVVETKPVEGVVKNTQDGV